MKTSLIILTVLFSSTNLLAQQRFDVVSYTSPKGWQQQQNEGGVQLSVSDNKTGAYAIALITAATASDGSAAENFTTDWEKLVKASVQVTGSPSMQAPSKENGWDVISGSAAYTDGEQKGSATLMTATAGGKKVSVILMTNTTTYQNELMAFVNSLGLVKATAGSTISNGRTIEGLWVNYANETVGYANGKALNSLGYIRKEYRFSSDGTYTYRQKNWLSVPTDFPFVYEKGTWSINGNQLTITPKEFTAGRWNKLKNDPMLWGSKLKNTSWKMEKITYNFEISRNSDGIADGLKLYCGKTTERDGTGTGYFGYSLRPNGNSWIDNPPGFSPVTETKPSTQATTINSPIAGKIWEAKSTEKYGAAYGSMSGYYTGGFWTYQYTFNADGTYSFVYNAASALATNPVNLLQYESGNYTVNGNQLTLTPLKGANEEWSVGKINNGMSAESIRNVLEKRIKKIRSSARKLEKMTYPFSVEYWQGNNANALCLKHTIETVREGSPGANNQSCFFETASGKAWRF